MLDHVRRTGTTVYHPCGTCRMGTDSGAAVDPALRLRGGVRGLRVADASVMPLVPSSNIQPAVTVVAERAADLPGVGRNLQDHLIARVGLRTKPAQTMNEVMASRWRLARTALGYALRRAGPLAIGAGEATLFAPVTPGAEEAEAQLFFINFCLSGSGGYTLPPHPGMMINFGQCRPESRGEISLRSPAPDDRPVIRANYLDAPQDRRIVADAARLARRVARTPPWPAWWRRSSGRRPAWRTTTRC